MELRQSRLYVIYNRLETVVYVYCDSIGSNLIRLIEITYRTRREHTNCKLSHLITKNLYIRFIVLLITVQKKKKEK